MTGRTQVYGIIGYPVRHSASPKMQTESFKHLGIDAVYVPFEVKPEDLERAVLGIKALGIKGVNVTIPHKERVLKFLDFVEDDAVFIGAVNTIKVEEGKLLGFNTDWLGFLKSIEEEGIKLEGLSALLIGAGGASKAVGYALLKGGCKELHIINRTFSRAKELADTLSQIGNVFAYKLSDSAFEVLLKKCILVVNTTSLGMKEEDPPIFDYSLLKSEHIVVDIIYNPLETKLIKSAKERGCKTVNGVGMLVYQGALAFEIWTGRKPPIEIMKKAVLESVVGPGGLEPPTGRL